MSIDWFTTGAQIINFLILVWLLKKLLFRPIIGAMERREQGISSHFQLAETKMNEAQALKQQYEKHLHQLQKDKDEVLATVREQVEIEKAASLQQLGEEIQQKKNRFDAEMQKQQQELGQLISHTIAEKSLSLGRHLLSRLADQTLEQRMIEHFLQNLSGLPEAEQISIKQTLLKDNSATIFTSFQAETAPRQQIQTWFESFAPGCKLLFEQRDFLVCGIALEMDGRSWEWNVDRYLTELGTELLKSSGQPS